MPDCVTRCKGIKLAHHQCNTNGAVGSSNSDCALAMLAAVRMCTSSSHSIWDSSHSIWEASGHCVRTPITCSNCMGSAMRQRCSPSLGESDQEDDVDDFGLEDLDSEPQEDAPRGRAIARSTSGPGRGRGKRTVASIDAVEVQGVDGGMEATTRRSAAAPRRSNCQSRRALRVPGAPALLCSTPHHCVRSVASLWVVAMAMR
jgi:hypothetical protein